MFCTLKARSRKNVMIFLWGGEAKTATSIVMFSTDYLSLMSTHMNKNDRLKTANCKRTCNTSVLLLCSDITSLTNTPARNTLNDFVAANSIFIYFFVAVYKISKKN